MYYVSADQQKSKSYTFHFKGFYHDSDYYATILGSHVDENGWGGAVAGGGDLVYTPSDGFMGTINLFSMFH